MIEAVAAPGRRAPPVEPIAAAVEAVANHPARLRTLAAALTGDPHALQVDPQPVVGRLVIELVAPGVNQPHHATPVVCRLWPGRAAAGTHRR
jgi:hypothetical protein